MEGENELTRKYVKMTPREHVLANPDTYIGSVEPCESVEWIYNRENHQSMPMQSIVFSKYVPGLFKLFDEAVVNAYDHISRMIDEGGRPLTFISVYYDASTGSITIVNDGDGIDVALHPEHNVYIPQLIFSDLLAGTNFDKSIEKCRGGKNGFGIKLAYIWSVRGYVETVDMKLGLHYYQEYNDNLTTISTPIIRALTPAEKKKGGFVKIHFVPDWNRFGVAPSDGPWEALFLKRTVDIAMNVMAFQHTVRVSFNNIEYSFTNFVDYAKLFVQSIPPTSWIDCILGAGWRVACVVISGNSVDTSNSMVISTVNGIMTKLGGTHVNYVQQRVAAKIVDYIQIRKKITVRPSSVIRRLHWLLVAQVVNPCFSGQQKDALTTVITKKVIQGSWMEIPKAFIETLCIQQGLMDMLVEEEERAIFSRTDGSKNRRVRDVPTLSDATFAGTRRSEECVLFLCEGESAKSGIMGGMTSNEYIGVLSLRGKLLNVAKATLKQQTDNKVINDLKKALGLEMNRGHTYTDTSSCRYGKLVIVCDQDVDGSHIKGLILNFFHEWFPSLIYIGKFLYFINTPIMKARRTLPGGQKEENVFYDLGAAETWKRQHAHNISLYNVKYYKGLATHTNEEFMSYIAKGDTKYVEFTGSGTDSIQSPNMMLHHLFHKEFADERKDLICRQYNPEKYLDCSTGRITIDDFVHHELLHFSMYDCHRSLPHMADGLKPSQRKVLYAALLKATANKPDEEWKVAQFSSYVSEKTDYHHGEESLNQTIIGMCQHFPGANNVCLLRNIGNFGDRTDGGKKTAGKPRYIYTNLSPLTKHLFHPDDVPLFTPCLDDQRKPIEPTFYLPVLPLLLLNGCKGVGTGFKCDSTGFHPEHVASYVLHILSEWELFYSLRPYSEWPDFTAQPHFEGFTGKTFFQKVTDDSFIEKSEDGESTDIHGVKYRCITRGHYEQIGPSTILVKELPIGVWGNTAKEKYDELVTKNILKDVETDFSGGKVNLKVEFPDAEKLEIAKGTLHVSKATGEMDGIEKLLGLVHSSIMLLVCFDAQGFIKRYESVEEYLFEWIRLRYEYYRKRKALLLSNEEHITQLLSAKIRFLHLFLDGHYNVDILRKDESTLLQWLFSLNFEAKQEDENATANKDDTPTLKDYRYLLDMPIRSFTLAHLQALEQKLQKHQAILAELQPKTLVEMWSSDIHNFLAAYQSQVQADSLLRHLQKENTSDNAAHAKKQAAAAGRKRRAIATQTREANKKAKNVSIV